MAGASFPEAFMNFFSWRAAFAINFSNSIVPAPLCQSPSHVPARANILEIRAKAREDFGFLYESGSPQNARAFGFVQLFYDVCLVRAFKNLKNGTDNFCRFYKLGHCVFRVFGDGARESAGIFRRLGARATQNYAGSGNALRFCAVCVYFYGGKMALGLSLGVLLPRRCRLFCFPRENVNGNAVAPSGFGECVPVFADFYS